MCSVAKQEPNGLAFTCHERAADALQKQRSRAQRSAGTAGWVGFIGIALYRIFMQRDHPHLLQRE
jgi:hypothetical protein